MTCLINKYFEHICLKKIVFRNNWYLPEEIININKMKIKQENDAIQLLLILDITRG